MGDVVEGFWAGARRHARAVDWDALVAAAGGVEALSRARAADLAAWGVAPDRAEAWCATRPERTQGRAITLGDPSYPASLKRTPSPPPVLCVEGDASALHVRGVGIVGTRRCSAYGRGVARHLGHRFAQAGRSVVSGLARGVDGAAHEAALSVGITVAVLGHGLDHTAPPSHARLRARIVEAGGAVVSTWPDDLGPAQWTFPKRNAWIAGLSEGVVVVEAGVRSGALITARHALDLGREVAAVPGPLGVPSSAGCNRLLADGAHAVHDVDAFVARWTGHDLPAADAWLDALFAGVPVPEVARRHGWSASEVLTRLGRLEVEGAVVRLAGGRYGPGRSSPA